MKTHWLSQASNHHVEYQQSRIILLLASIDDQQVLSSHYQHCMTHSCRLGPKTMSFVAHTHNGNHYHWCDVWKLINTRKVLWKVKVCFDTAQEHASITGMNWKPLLSLKHKVDLCLNSNLESAVSKCNDLGFFLQWRHMQQLFTSCCANIYV